MSILNNRREDCGFGCLFNRYKTPIMIGGGVLSAMALPFAGPAIAGGLASLGASEAIAGGVATAGTALLGALPSITGQAVGMAGQEQVKYDDNAPNPNYGDFYQPRPVFGKQGVYQ